MRHWRLQYRAGKAGLGIACCLALLCVGKPTPAHSTGAPAPQLVVAHHCLAIDSSHAVVLQLTSPDDGLLRVEVEEHGISTVSLLNDDLGSSSASPIDRLGTVVLSAKVRRSEHTKVAVRVDDSLDIRGEICVSAELLSPRDILRTQAELDFSGGGRATQKTEWAAAFSRYLRAARTFDYLGLRFSAAKARHAMAELAYLRFDRKRDSYALAGEALAAYARSANPALLGELATLRAKALLDMPEEKIGAIAREVRRCLTIGRRYASATWYGAREVPRIDIMNGFLDFMLDDPARSRQIFFAVAANCRELRDWDCYAMARQNSALLAEEDKNYSVALAAYADALRLLPPELDLKLSADIWNNLGRLQGVVGLFNASEHSHAAAMRAFAKLGDCLGVRRSLVRSGNLRVHVGNLADAQSDLERAGSYTCPNLLASASLPANQPSGDAVLELNRAQRNGRDVGVTSLEHTCAHPVDPAPLTTESKIVVFDSVLSLGNAAMMTGDSAELWRCLNAAAPYAVSSRTQIRLANARGAAYLERKDPAHARAAFTRALLIADKAGLPATYEHRGPAQIGLVNALLLSGKVADSLPQAYGVLEASTRRGDIESTITSLRLIAAGYRGSGQPARAIHVLQVAADLIEAVPIDQLDGEQQATFLASQHTVFAELTDLYASSQEDGNDSAAWLGFSASERGRARSLRYALNQETRNAASPVQAPPTAKYQELLSEVAAVQEQVNQPPELIDQIERLALHDNGPVQPFDRTQLARTLKQLGVTLVEYASGSNGMLAFVVTGEHLRVVHLGDTREIAQATAQLRDLLRDTEAPAAEVRRAAQELARLVLWPIVPFLQEPRIVVVPDDALHTVPLSVLPWAPDPNQQLVLHHAEVTVIPSALFLMRVPPGASIHSEMPRMALIGDPVFRVSDWRRECTDTDHDRKHVGSVSRSLGWTESLPRLPGSRSEVTGIARLARESRPASRIETLIGCAAVPTALRKAADSDVDLLHIATHARIDAQRPRLSALALTPESPADTPASTFGLLDILGLKLNSKLVVLSACETSRGRLLPGEGVLGPAQAFLQAGSAAVLASYWRVDDEITATFMQRFYRYLIVERLSASAALRKTQLESAASGRTYEWAAFSLYGWPDSSI